MNPSDHEAGMGSTMRDAPPGAQERQRPHRGMFNGPNPNRGYMREYRYEVNGQHPVAARPHPSSAFHANPPSGEQFRDGRPPRPGPRPPQGGGQWPLPNRSPLRPSHDRSYRPPPGNSQQQPRRPPRPNRVMSPPEQREHPTHTPRLVTPQARSINEMEENNPEVQDGTSLKHSSRLTTSSVGTIPEFPVPTTASPISATTTTTVESRKSGNLGPPPSSRRGASSFYSNASYVLPIPEESQKSRSHGSYASSAVMPDTWVPEGDRVGSPDGVETFYEESITDKSRDSILYEFADDCNLVRSASLGKKGRAALVTTKPVNTQAVPRPYPIPKQPLDDGKAHMEASTNSSGTLPNFIYPFTMAPTIHEAPDTPEPIADIKSIVEVSEESISSDGTQTPPRSPQLATRQPLKLDIDAVRSAEARGSLTSLPDLIRRATRLAAMIEGGKRPASRFEDLSEYLNEKLGSGEFEKDRAAHQRYRSGLSDMLAAFPPPADANRQSRGSWFRSTSWPLAPGLEDETTSGAKKARKPSRKCCGVPIWLFILLIIFLLCGIAAAIVLPLEIFVFKNIGNSDQQAKKGDSCSANLTCQNGGIDVVSQGVCSCICTNGFYGPDCGRSATTACATTSLISADGTSSMDDVTFGKAVPRLVANAKGNFSVPLSGTAILAKMNAADLSCIAQNSLVTFNGRSVGVGESSDIQKISDDGMSAALDATTPAVTSVPTATPNARIRRDSVTVGTESLAIDTAAPPVATEALSTTATASATATSSTATATGMFQVTDEALDFARVVVLYVLQEVNIAEAQAAQTNLQTFFTMAGQDASVSTDSATRVSLGPGMIVDLVDFNVNIGSGSVGQKNVKRAVEVVYGTKTRVEKIKWRGAGPLYSTR